MLQVKDDAVFASEPVGPVRSAGPDTFPPPAGEITPREAPQPAVQRHRALHQALRGNLNLPCCV